VDITVVNRMAVVEEVVLVIKVHRGEIILAGIIEVEMEEHHRSQVHQ
jgi:hypothetical protein